MENNESRKHRSILTFGLFKRTSDSIKEQTKLQVEDQAALKRDNDSQSSRLVGGIICAVVFSFVGSFAGYQIYLHSHHKQGGILEEPTSGTADYQAEEIEASLAKGSLVEDFSERSYQLINYAYDNFAKSSYNLVIGAGSAVANTGPIKVNQSIDTATYNTPDGFFNEKVSHSSFVNTASRYYENTETNDITAFEYSKREDWKDAKPTRSYSYDDYIQSFGKLGKGIYYCVDAQTDQNHPIPERFLTFDSSVYEQSNDESKHERNGVLIYNLTEETVLKNSPANAMVKTDSGYQITLEMNIENSYGIGFSQVEMRSTGSLSSLPTYTKSVLTFQLDQNLNLQSALFHDEYKALKSIVVANISSDLYQYYFTSDSSSFTMGEKDISLTIPDIQETHFKGFDLVSEKK